MLGKVSYRNPLKKLYSNATEKLRRIHYHTQFRAAFEDFCCNNGVKLTEFEANDHETYATVDKANRTPHNSFRRFRAEIFSTEISKFMREATNAKNICKGSKLTSSFELMYGQSARILTDYYVVDFSCFHSNVRDTASKRIDNMVKCKPRKLPDIKVGDFVLYWRDKKRWFGPEKVL